MQPLNPLPCTHLVALICNPLQSNWKAKHSLPYSLLCDPSKETLKVLGILQGGKIVRSHIVVAKGGEVVDVRWGGTWDGGVFFTARGKARMQAGHFSGCAH